MLDRIIEQLTAAAADQIREENKMEGRISAKVPELAKVKAAVRTLGEYFRQDSKKPRSGDEDRKFTDAVAAFAMIGGFVAGIDEDTQLRDYILKLVAMTSGMK